MKPHSLLALTLLSGAIIFNLGSCQHQLVPEPNGNGSSEISYTDLKDSILPPKNVKASHGNYRTIELTWDEVKNATQYQIFSADTPYDNFIQVAETAGTETTITMDQESGVIAYYMVKAVNYYGTVSKGSTITSGSTMDTPIITEINSVSDGNSVVVKWWMGNCSKDTYEDNIQYVINCYDKSRNKVPGTEKIVDGSENSVTIAGLSPKTEYYFTVEVMRSDGIVQKNEKSDFTTASTAHRIFPEQPGNLVATKGTDSSKVLLSWELPPAADYYDKKTMIYSSHPVYFKIDRKELNAEDSAYETIVDYIGCVIDDGDLTGKKFKFDCSTNTTSNSKLTVTKSEDEAAVTDEVYTNYTSLSKLTFEDVSAEKGKQYSYRIQSYTDAAKDVITDDTSISSDKGWKLSEVKFKAVSTPEDRVIDVENNKITSINVNFDLDFEDFDCDYTYVTTYERTDLRSHLTDAETILHTTNNKSELNDYTYTFNDTDDESVQGYYTYKLYVIPHTTENITSLPAEIYETISSKGKVAVISESDLIPEITNFSILDGYSDKFVMKWDEVSGTEGDVVYTVNWTELGGASPVEDSLEVTADLYTVEDGVVTFEHEAQSGNIRKYTLDITKQGIPASQEYETICHTLGTPEPVMEIYDYQDVTVTWPKVDKATKYEVSAYYQADESKTNIAVDPKFTTDERTGEVTCVISQISGYDDITKSGLPICFTVNAINEDVESSNKTDKDLTVRTLGPALINTKAETETIFRDYLKMSWDKVEGATGYIIYRTKYKYDDNSNWVFDKADKYYYDASGDTESARGSVKINGEDIAKKRVEISLQNNTYTFKDKDCDIEDDKNSYQENQSQISWGIPFGYVVIPVKGDEKDFTFGTDADYLKASLNKAENGFSYTTAFTADKVSTIGYGLKVKAAKSESAEAIKVEWKKPFHTDLVPTLYRKKFNKEENHDYGSSWEKVKTLSTTAESYEDTLSLENISSAFVYAVQYQAPTESNFSKSFRDNLQNLEINEDERYDFTDHKEVYNKGYLLTLADFTAEYGGTGTEPGDPSYYQENVTWNKIWDYEERALGPDSFTINIKNRNLSSTMDWSKVVATVTVTDGTYSKPSTSNTYNDTIIGALDAGITLKPKGLSEGTATETNDILKVLRDAKHYYSVSLTRGNQEPVMQAADNSIYAYRQISDEELCKCVSLIIADALYKTAIPDRKIYSYEVNGGAFTLECSQGVFDANKVQWHLIEFTNNFENGCSSNDPNKITSFLTLSSNTSTFNDNGIKDKKLFYLPPLDITVTSSIPLSSYKGLINFTVGKAGTSLEKNITIKKDKNTVVSISKSNDMYNWFPYDLGTQHSEKDSTANPNLNTYKSPWWN